MSAHDDSPFHTSPNPTTMYVTPSLARTLDKVRYVVGSRQGLTVIFGMVGLGKSTVMRYLEADFKAREDMVAVYLESPTYKSEMAMLKAICSSLKLPSKRSQLDQESELRRFLIEAYKERKNVVVLVDEAQLIRGPNFELVRSLLNFETNTQKLINFVLCGQLELHGKLADPSKAGIRSRIILYSNLDPMSLDEADKMLRFRAERAQIPYPFTPETVEAIYDRAKGIPRDILKHAGAAYHLALRNRLAMVPMEAVTMTETDVYGTFAALEAGQ